MSASVTVLGVPEVLARFARAAVIGETAAGMAVDTLGMDIAMHAAAQAPVDTGTLRDSIAYDSEGTDGVVHVDAPYAGFVEYGTSDTPAQPFFRPAVDTVDDTHAIAMAAAVMETA